MTLREEISQAMSRHNEVFPDDVEGMTLTEKELEDQWQLGFINFTLWTKNRVYFTAQYDSDSTYWVASVPRHPCDEKYSISQQDHAAPGIRYRTSLTDVLRADREGS